MPRKAEYPKRITLPLTDEQMSDVEDWRFENRVSTRLEAIRRLIDTGLNAVVAFLVVEKLDGRLLRELEDVSVRMPDGLECHLVREESGTESTDEEPAIMLAFRSSSWSTIHLRLLYEDQKIALLGLSEGHLLTLERCRPKLREKAVPLVPLDNAGGESLDGTSRAEKEPA